MVSLHAEATQAFLEITWRVSQFHYDGKPCPQGVTTLFFLGGNNTIAPKGKQHPAP